MMRLLMLFHALYGLVSTRPYYTMTVYAPETPAVNGKVINANGRAFVIGALQPTTYCPNTKVCHNSDRTLIDGKMTLLASAVPGGQDIYVSPDGSISYPLPHSAYRPVGAQMGGFRAARNVSAKCAPGAGTLLKWKDESGATGLWACPRGNDPWISTEAVLKASTVTFKGEGCKPVDGVIIWEGGDAFGAWAYS